MLLQIIQIGTAYSSCRKATGGMLNSNLKAKALMPASANIKACASNKKIQRSALLLISHLMSILIALALPSFSPECQRDRRALGHFFLLLNRFARHFTERTCCWTTMHHTIVLTQRMRDIQ